MTLVYRIEISPSALQDVRSCYEYIAETSEGRAHQWFRGLQDAIKSLEVMPLRFSLAPESDLLGVEVRHYVYEKNYRILYTVQDRVVKIHHMRHSARQRMNEEDFIF
jgi:plasmid stabilization system protein ParE